ncbi:MAG: hypothetical protein J6R50_01015 [Alistipes sp.]|nr:hypothetical protein [Alistipes sp.]MBO7265478.1 hypothetical protein [Alistipes sp.]
MKKLLLALVAMLVVSGAFAQDYKNSIGLRLGYGAELQYERHFSSENYLEANLGLSGFNGRDIFVNATYNWNLCDWNWTPNAGRWFLSAGVGGALGVWGHDNDKLGFQVGVAGDVAFGIRFNKPVTLSLDYRPTVYFLHNAWGHGFYGVGLTCTYNF